MNLVLWTVGRILLWADAAGLELCYWLLQSWDGRFLLVYCFGIRLELCKYAASMPIASQRKLV